MGATKCRKVYKLQKPDTIDMLKVYNSTSGEKWTITDIADTKE